MAEGPDIDRLLEEVYGSEVSRRDRAVEGAVGHLEGATRSGHRALEALAVGRRPGAPAGAADGGRLPLGSEPAGASTPPPAAAPRPAPSPDLTAAPRPAPSSDLAAAPRPAPLPSAAGAGAGVGAGAPLDVAVAAPPPPSSAADEPTRAMARPAPQVAPERPAVVSGAGRDIELAEGGKTERLRRRPAVP